MATDYKKIAEENIKKYGTDISRYGPVLLAHLYSDRTHFIYEILQNAEDAGARINKKIWIRFNLFKDRIEIRHNGKLFDAADVQGICGLVEGTKKDDLTQIGKFGIGFKSVYAYTKNPKIYSGDEAFCIEDYVLPHAVGKIGIPDTETLFVFPFDHHEITPEQSFKEISARIRDIGTKTLLFLNHIEEISWHIDGEESGTYIREIKTEEYYKKVYIICKVGNESVKDEEWLILGKPIQLNASNRTNLKVEVAFKTEKDKNGKELFVPIKDSKLIVFFPTEKPTYLNFLVQGPYKTTPNRENIPLEDQQNKTILEETGNLIAEKLTIVKNLGYLDVNFLSILPLNSELAEREQIYSVIYEKVKEKFLSEKLLPTSDSTYTKAVDALLARGKELTEFLDNNDIQNLFSKQNWLDTNITYDKTRELRDYLINELGVIEVDFENFARKITPEFLETKSDNWMVDFYKRLLDQQSLWSEREYSKGVLRTKPIIRLENNKHIAPFDNNGKVQVYLPAETKSEYKTVKRILTKNEESLKFLKELGLTKPDLLAEIREFILPKYQTENPTKDERYFDDFEKLLKGYESIQSSEKEKFVKKLANASFIYAVKNDNTEESCLLKACQTYFSDDDLKNYFDGYQSVYFVSRELYEKFGEEKVKEFLKELGVEDKPRRIEIGDNLTGEEKSKLRGNSGCSYDIYQKDYAYEGLDNFIKNITPERSYLLWKLLLKSIKNLNSYQAQKFFKGEYRWFYYSEHSKSFEAKLSKMLKQKTWLVDKNGNFKKSSEITFSDLSDDYSKKENPNISILIKALEFKPEIIDQLPENDRKILEIARAKNITPDELEKILSERKEKPSEQEKERWTPEFEPDKTPVRIQEEEPVKIVTPDLSGQIESIEAGRDGKSTKEIEKPEKEVEKTPIDKKAIGMWGEKYVYNALKEKYQEQGDIIETDSGFKVIDADGEEFEIVWLNKHQDKGKGYDFVIRRNETETDYIEVKTKIGESEELIEVTGSQWEFARKLFEQNEGERYSFYVVSNAGKENAQIHIRRNPIKLWKEGKLYAHPINFKL